MARAPIDLAILRVLERKGGEAGWYGIEMGLTVDRAPGPRPVGNILARLVEEGLLIQETPGRWRITDVGRAALAEDTSSRREP